MMVKGKAVEVEVVVAAVAVGGRRLWPAICHKENLIALIIAVAAMATVVIPALVVMEGLAMVSLQL